MRTARTLEAEWRQVLLGKRGYGGAKEDESSTGRVWATVLKATSQGHGTALTWEWREHGMCKSASAVQRRHMGDLPAFGFFRLPRGFSRRKRHCRRMAGAWHGMACVN
jgi:hypothetical protein